MDQRSKASLDVFVMSVVTVAYVGLTVETFLLHWENWVAPILVIALVCLWAAYIPRKIRQEDLRLLLFIYGMLATFYHGAHKTSIFDVVVVASLMLTVYSLFDKMYMLNMILIEFTVIMLMQVYMNHSEDMSQVDALLISRIILHSMAVICIYLFCRLTVKKRIIREEELEQRELAEASDKYDMEDLVHG